MEAAAVLGGQLVLAAKATWRRGLAGITAWLSDELERLDVAVRLNCLAGESDVLAQAPDVVVVATGGLPAVGRFEGSSLATTTWDVLSGVVPCEGEVLVHNEHGGHAALACAEHLAASGARVRIVTPHSALGTELGDTNRGAHLSEIHRHGIDIRVDYRLVAIERNANRLRARIASMYSGAVEIVDCDRVVCEHGTLANDELYHALKPHSRNLGEVDMAKLARFEPPAIDRNPHGRFVLFRIGDAWASRNVHAAMLDAMRTCKDL
jgi:hypothetical protein